MSTSLSNAPSREGLRTMLPEDIPGIDQLKLALQELLSHPRVNELASSILKYLQEHGNRIPGIVLDMIWKEIRVYRLSKNDHSRRAATLALNPTHSNSPVA